MTKEREQLMNELATDWCGKYDIESIESFEEGFKAADAHPTERELKLVEVCGKTYPSIPSRLL